ncbi:peptide-methionine (S)-S-oxide reductase MsrA [Nitratifractor salsuginis]|uniref:Peptide methionine sulfoxide reductase MsrA n=1 Tax=Nitratifractor salsuginis (strain DSM 16511 / JCM 12458 / E9I37-1) TaxID=749222 RepID=E6WYI9_NITSE|nr:peptide-methionine (S)-S-oxide reductase MsrA [Nitratifractor salsuginis]ADV46501.1 peptide methionine sulfoxide reductase [Nitratifractor salsuginis DSM 16511]
MAIREAILGGGCFWCLDAAFRQVDGVVDVISGYANGHVANPTYKEVCTDTTGHAEVVKVLYDDSKISYRDLLKIFYAIHDPTTLNRQGADFGSQYRSTILYQNEEERKIAEEVTAEVQKGLERKIVTRIEPLKNFYPAEEYHQNYFAKNPHHGYCQVVVAPKVLKVREKFPEKVKH